MENISNRATLIDDSVGMTLSPKDRDDWLTRWQEGRIQFHVDKVNPILNRYVDRLLPEGFGCVFVPLCGKSVDLDFLVLREIVMSNQRAYQMC